MKPRAPRPTIPGPFDLAGFNYTNMQAQIAHWANIEPHEAQKPELYGTCCRAILEVCKFMVPMLENPGGRSPGNIRVALDGLLIRSDAATDFSGTADSMYEFGMKLTHDGDGDGYFKQPHGPAAKAALRSSLMEAGVDPVIALHLLLEYGLQAVTSTSGPTALDACFKYRNGSTPVFKHGGDLQVAAKLEFLRLVEAQWIYALNDPEAYWNRQAETAS